ncbi:nucleotidyltransferase domain-containing protein [Phycicoccus endophyticus]|uniref:Nucleotidyltransferase domain-containing protein n=1 Tax=Phycicoccus endophyticus TaxID=1690220 RepID=A0A7G9R2L0_9MICO|nr:nucleotidyltransferase domain-containing protein [Phycicoccus endophyticus]NHI20703.1 nucleotidyltransferase domain-containing protein [Phycicoccus endophyticus]QNN49835.1 nucleotidyltransferase domain-containing protein [Phycicoccus endophyticus]
MPAPLEDLPPALRPAVRRLASACRDEERVLAAWLGGSLARGHGDAWSDVDLHLAVTDASRFDPLAWAGGVLPLVLADPIPGVRGGYVLLTQDGLHVDVVLHPGEERPAPGEPVRTLLDRRGLLADTPGRLEAPGPPRLPAQEVRLFLYLMYAAVAAVHRGEVEALAHGASVMRDELLVSLMLAEGGRDGGSGKRLAARLTAEQREALAALPPVGVDQAGLLTALEALAGEYLARGRRLAARCASGWPESLEAMVLARWADQLGLRPAVRPS